MTLAYPPQTHVMVPPSLRDRLKELSRATRVAQSHYHREAARLALSAYGGEVRQPFPPRGATTGFVSIVFRLGDPDLHEGLRALSERTRVGVGEYMRLGLEAVITAHEGGKETA